MSENADVKYLRWSKTNLSKETKKDSKKRYAANLRSSRREVFCKKGVLENFATCLIAYYQSRHLKIVDSNLPKPVKIMKSEQIVLAAILVSTNN